MTPPPRLRARPLCSLLTTAFHGALQDIDLRDRTRRACADLAHTGPVDVLAVGKAAPRMLDGATDALGRNLGRVLVVTTDGTACEPGDNRVVVLRASHPEPDERSAAAASAAVEFASTSPANALLVLVSGGASSLLCAPFDASVDEYRALTRALLASGADIHEINVVRRHLSAVHGGRLAEATTAAVHVVVASDVIAGAPHDVGSGPASVDPTTVHEAARVLHRHLEPGSAAWWSARLRETPKPDGPIATRVTSRIVVGPEDFADAMARQLRDRGFTTTVETRSLAAAQDLSASLVEAARGLKPSHAHVVSCEPTLTLPQPHGRGGRSGWVALAALLELPPETALLAGASDGVDGSSGGAGACVSHADAELAQERRVVGALRDRDDATIHEELGTQLPGVPTGLNVTDVYVVVRDRA